MKKFPFLKSKLIAIYKILKSKSFILSVELQPQDEFKSILKSNLKNYMKVGTPEQEHALINLADKVSSDIFDKTPKERSFNEVIDSFFQDAVWDYSMVAGLTCIWEAEFRLLAASMGVQILTDDYKRTRKQNNTETIGYRKMIDIIDDFKKLNNGLDLNLKNIWDIRGALVHSNFDLLKKLMSHGSKIKDRYKGNVFLLEIGKPKKVKNISEIPTYSEKKSINPYGIMLDAYNSALFSGVWELFKESLNQIKILIEFQSMSFDDRVVIYAKIFKNNGIFSTEDIIKYKKYIKTSAWPERDVKKFFEIINSCFERDLLGDIVWEEVL